MYTGYATFSETRPLKNAKDQTFGWKKKIQDRILFRRIRKEKKNIAILQML